MKPISVALAVFLLIFVVVRRISPTGILLYQGIVVGFLVAASLWLFLKKRWDLTTLQSFKDALLVFCLIYSFVFTVPTTVDRAYSVQMIHRLAEAKDGLTTDQLSADYTSSFVNGGGLDKRIHEQIATGLIKEENGKFVLTQTGYILDRIFRLTAELFSCPTRSHD